MTRAEYNHIVKEWANNVFRFALKTINDAEEAKDVVQQAFEVLWTRHESIDFDKGKSYLFTVAHRRCMDYYRRAKPREIEQVPEIITHNDQSKNEWRAYLQEALKILDRQSKQLVLLKDYEGYSYQEIGEITGLNESQVKVYLHRARKLLKNYLIQKKQLL